ncbi:MAG: S41 family peptidase [Hyphomicrobiaceae bacterium]|nr:S41 family peptidase [Hyphomicrobiaceae bacterium]
MSARSRGAPIWSALSTIAIRISTLFLVVVTNLVPQQAWGMDSVARITAAVNAVSNGPYFSHDVLRKSCAGNLLCVARLIARKLGPKARLEKRRHPDTDEIRRVRNRPSLMGQARNDGKTLHISLAHFGRKARTEISQALLMARKNNNGAAMRELIIDLRGNQGGRFDRMLKLVASFTGAVPKALYLKGTTGNKAIALPAPATHYSFDKIHLLVGPKTASSAEIFAALLRVHTKASISGARTYGKNWLLRVIPVNHDWQLLVPAETVTVPGTELSEGLRPDKNSLPIK